LKIPSILKDKKHKETQQNAKEGIEITGLQYMQHLYLQFKAFEIEIQSPQANNIGTKHSHCQASKQYEVHQTNYMN
jgi:hypothetical protein